MSVVLRTVYYHVKKWMLHVAWMKSRAGGTLIADAEADYWFQKIKMANYRPIWRWYYGNAWTKWGTQVEADIKKRSVARKVGYANAVLAALIVLVFLFANVNIRLVPEIQVTTEVELQYYSGNLLVRSFPDDILDFWSFTLVNTSKYGWHEGGATGFVYTVTRADSAFISKPITLNVTSSVCYGPNSTQYNCVESVSFLILREDNSERRFNTTGDGNLFTMTVDLAQGEIIQVYMAVFLNAFSTDDYQLYFAFQSTGMESPYIYVSGGYERANPR